MRPLPRDIVIVRIAHVTSPPIRITVQRSIIAKRYSRGTVSRWQAVDNIWLWFSLLKGLSFTVNISESTFEVRKQFSPLNFI